MEKANNDVIYYTDKAIDALTCFGDSADNVKEFALKVACVNSFIIATALVVIEFINNFILKLLVATLIMIPLIIILYYLVAKSMKKEGK